MPTYEELKSQRTGIEKICNLLRTHNGLICLILGILCISIMFLYIPFGAMGTIQKIVVPNGADHFDSTLETHYHFNCSVCGKMFDVPRNVTLEIHNAVEEMQKQGFSIEGHNLIFTGICPECRKNGQN